MLLVGPLAQWRQAQGGAIKAVVKILAEPALVDQPGRVPVGGGDHPAVHLHRLFRPQGQHLALRQYP